MCPCPPVNHFHSRGVSVVVASNHRLQIRMSGEEIQSEPRSEEEDKIGIVSLYSNELDDEESEAEETAESNESDDEVVTISREDLMSLQLFRNICFNIRENLEAIKSSKKVPLSLKVTNLFVLFVNILKTFKETLLPERKAVYLSILDSAINGSYHIRNEDIIAVFGV